MKFKAPWATNIVYMIGRQGESLSSPWAKAKKKLLLKMKIKGSVGSTGQGRLLLTRIFLECPSHRNTHLAEAVCTSLGLMSGIEANSLDESQQLAETPQ